MSTDLNKEQLKERALLYVDRHVKKLEEVVNVDHKILAMQGLSYADRQRAEEKAEAAKNEYEAMLWVRDLVVAQEV